MTPLFVSPLRRMTVWTTLMSLVVLALAFSLSACGGDATPAASTSSSTSSAPAASVADALTVTITEQTGGNDIYSFSPKTTTLKAGGAIKFTNNSDENHKLAITPAGPTAGTVAKSGSNDNTMTVTFPTAGTYTVTSQLIDRPKDGKHTPDPADSKATLTVTVS
jgi:plastocyanin